MEPITNKIDKFNDINDNELKNEVVETIWKTFLNEHPDILNKLNELGKIPDCKTAGAELVANGMYNEALLWKDYRRNNIKKIM